MDVVFGFVFWRGAVFETEYLCAALEPVLVLAL